MTNLTTARSIIREKAFQALYLLSTRQELKVDDALAQTLDSHAELEVTDLSELLKNNMPEAYQGKGIVNDSLVFLKQLVQGVRDNQEAINETISQHLNKRSLSRVELANHVILSLAVYELVYLKENAPSIIIDEAVELAKTFNDDPASKFVNGVLQSVVNELDK